MHCVASETPAGSADSEIALEVGGRRRRSVRSISRLHSQGCLLMANLTFLGIHSGVLPYLFSAVRICMRSGGSIGCDVRMLHVA